MSLEGLSVAYRLHSMIFDLALRLGELPGADAQEQAESLGRCIHIQRRRGELSPGSADFLNQQLAIVILHIPRRAPAASVQ